jgi:hydroxymethylpyrimidine/phosphomethylpyrimidine kinase
MLIAGRVAAENDRPIVLDPVLAATSGVRFQGPRQVAALRSLIAIAAIVTPNAPEAAVLAGFDVHNISDAERAARAIAATSGAALVTGGHLTGKQCVDVLVRAGRVTRYRAARLQVEMRGSGCLLAAALAAHLARGEPIEEAVKRARSFVRRALVASRPLGAGPRRLMPI